MNINYSRFVLLPLLLVSLCFSLPATSMGKTPSYFPILNDVKAESERHPKQMFLVLVSQTGCIPCANLTNKVLMPLKVSGDYSGKVVFREISLDSGETIVNFAGQTLETQAFVSGFTEPMSPTLLFLSPEGEELHEAMKGVGPLELYSYYVEKAIDKGLKALSTKI